MAKKTSTKKSSTKKTTTASTKPKKTKKWFGARWVQGMSDTSKDLLSRRPHRSFRLTRRRDYARSLKLPGYVAFTGHVFATLRKHRFTFIALIAVYAILGILFGSMVGQETYNQIGDLLREGSGDLFEGGFGQIWQAGLLAVSTFTGGQGLSEAQQVYLAIIFLLTWLTTVWLLREFLAGRRPSFRDGLYNSSAPLISTLFVALVLLLQTIPFGIMLIAQSALGSVGISIDGLWGMLFYVLMGLMLALSLYWVTATFFALVIVTLPGMYPRQALKTAGDLVVGRRLRVLYRLIWAFLVVAVVWLCTVVPLVLLTNWIGGMWDWFTTIPVVPLFVVCLGAATTVWLCAYVYLLYRKVVEDDTSPA